MRTTLNLPDDIYEIARSLAHTSRISLGDALAELVRKGLAAAPAVSADAAFPYFAVRRDARPITLEETLDAEDAL